MGTRPEIIKFAPVIRLLENNSNFNSLVLSTAQHREMSSQFLSEFNLKADYNLDVMTSNQSLAYLTSKISERIDEIFTKVKPDFVLVQGDTTTAYISGLVAFYHKIPLGHIEAGLRTFDPYSPFPEEINRQMLSRIASLNFVPTILAKENLLKENISVSTIYYTGNTIVDSLNYLIDNNERLRQLIKSPSTKDIILVTAHRRENLGIPMNNICHAILEIIDKKKDIEFIFPVHPNPKVRETVYGILDNVKQVNLIEPVDYNILIEYMIKSKIILTDSGGIQEESPTLKKPVLVMRSETERPEVVKAGGAILVGTDKEYIVSNVLELLNNQDKYNSMTNILNPFGDGLASERIIDCLLDYFSIERKYRVTPLEEYYSNNNKKTK